MATLTVLSSGKEPKVYELDKPKMVIGRDPGCDIHIDNLAVSRRHVEVTPQGDTFHIKDLETANKTYVNGGEIKEHVLKDGDEIVIGNYKLKFSNPKKVVSDPNKPPPPPQEEFNEPTFVLPPEVLRKKLQEMQGVPPQMAAAPAPVAKPAGGGAPVAAAAAPAKAVPQAVPVAAGGAPAPKSNMMMYVLLGGGCLFILLALAVVAGLMFAGVIQWPGK